MAELDASSLYIVRRHEGLKSIYGEAGGGRFSQGLLRHNLEELTPRIPKVGHLFGDLVSTADILLMTCLDWASGSGVALPQQALDYRRRVAQRRAYQEALKRNFPSHPG
jgi:glutathione S-transferase